MNVRTEYVLKCFYLILASIPLAASAQINTGSTGSDGALDYSSLTNLGYSTNIVIDMHDHPSGIYQYTYVNIPNNATVSFIPNTSNTPVSWLVQSNVIINGIIDISGSYGNGNKGGVGGPGGWQGGNGSPSATAGQGAGGGSAGGAGAYNCSGGNGTYNYGNVYLIPLLGGSGGGGDTCNSYGGGGGGGALLIAASATIFLNGSINASGGTGNGSGYSNTDTSGGDGCGGAIRLVASLITGAGSISDHGGNRSFGQFGRVRFDAYDNEFSGGISGQFSSGSQFIVIPTSGQLPQLTVTSVGGVSVSPTPTGTLATPDAVISAQATNPIPVVVNCANLPLNSLITVSIKPTTGSPVSATGYNSAGTLASSTATILITIPRGGGLIYAVAATGN